ncbi:hypothetical protein [Gemmobacter denitrificans]|uniref:Uncharacterized protein n=1 Tax=Gemmobacter denitrificans TaxID=3123040 RepID=A0ABU8BTM4_9RHOB
MGKADPRYWLKLYLTGQRRCALDHIIGRAVQAMTVRCASVNVTRIKATSLLATLDPPKDNLKIPKRRQTLDGPTFRPPQGALSGGNRQDLAAKSPGHSRASCAKVFDVKSCFGHRAAPLA